MNENFLWGTATASYQCEGGWNEGGRVPSLWDVYLHENNLENGDDASDHYHKYKEDIRLMKEGGHKAYRFSIAWPRIIKNKEGEVNPEGIQFYHNVIDECLKNGIEPFVTLFHWDLPQYLEDRGGWIERDICSAFVEYARVCFEAYKDKVTFWSTFNEPRYYVFSGYKIGNYPPGLDDTQKTIQGSFYMMLANALTVKLFREMKVPGQIGIVHSYAPVSGVDNSLETKIAMRKADNFFNNWILDTAIKGEIPIDMLSILNEKYDLSFMKEEDFEEIKQNTVDFVGLNYYARALIKPYTSGETILRINNKGKEAKGTSKVVVKDWFEQVFDNPDSTYTEWDTEIYPQGLYQGIMQAYRKYGIPIYITENGIAFYEDVPNEESVDDQGRIHFLNEHIDAILRAAEDGADVRGYFVWSTMDIYSWKNGHEKRYGLIGVDFDNNFERKPKSSYYWYKRVCESNGATIERSKR
ncbi:glycoside hydrolase family 1 protein [Virgibacillus sp. NKC19-3]|uniref:glycoside hydrolase family 1 protein n=1 Tax=Virgibacillus saliphilus TaxID=2831674 RepID=UPI001C9B8A4A|nr:glycoside hydrolase family 1 protein [Virgibacillus sp. NKC19-3]MBY7141975.1 glycoside hydrolase family 1 protein [Virgibacillus sp. NKC19-3]